MRDLSRLMRSDTEKLGFSLQLKNDDALNEWSINLFGFSDCPLAEVRKPFCTPDTLQQKSLLRFSKGTSDGTRVNGEEDLGVGALSADVYVEAQYPRLMYDAALDRTRSAIPFELTDFLPHVGWYGMVVRLHAFCAVL